MKGRLEGKVALITGGAGNIGEVITRRYLEEGATVVITGRNITKLETYKTKLVEEGFEAAKIFSMVADGGNIAQVRAALEKTVTEVGQFNILVNNAGSAGAKQPLHRIPFTAEDLEALKKEGFADTETLSDAFKNLLGISWNYIRAAYPFLSPSASVINVSTIFSRTDYYGRIPYVVPKAALNALSVHLARELGRSEKGIRLNTVYPGPIDSERIRTVFKAMDGLKGQPEGSTAQSFFDIMRLQRPNAEGKFEPGFPKKEDVANTIVFLGSDEAAAYSGHVFEVTNGMDVPAESKSSFVSRPGLRIVDATGKVVLVLSGEQVTDAVQFARVQAKCGAEVVLGFRKAEALEEAREMLVGNEKEKIHIFRMDPAMPETITGRLEDVFQKYGKLDAALILPASSPETYGLHLLEASDETVEAFIKNELEAAVTIASYLAKYWRTHDEIAHSFEDTPKIIFVTNGSDGNGNTYADVYREGIEQLCRVWRHEEETDVASGKKKVAVWANQIVRYSNTEPENLNFAASWAAKLLSGDRRIDEIDLYLPANIVEATGAQKPSFGWAESLFGLHLGKIALITGGSAGIGGQIGRLLALSGAKVVLAARRKDQLEEMRDGILEELRAIGYNKPEKRVVIIPDADVADEEACVRMVDITLKEFGRIDYLINNAGMSGAEEMVIDMPLDKWRYTLKGNLISNYSLIYKVAPIMKKQGNGYVVNVSSYFGGEKYVAVPYPNRADYAVSKAGQRALVEMLARFLGPEIQINAIAPGPVEGIRLAGEGGRPGLYQRRARLIMEGRRLSEVYNAIIEARRLKPQPAENFLALLSTNLIEDLAANPEAPAGLKNLAIALLARKKGEATSNVYLMNKGVARKLVARLELGGFLEKNELAEKWLAELPEAPEPYFNNQEIEKEATKIRDATLAMLNLNRMPNEQDVALATIYYLADRNVSGETFHPSGGLRFDRTVTEGELFGKPSPGRLEKFYGRPVIIMGEYMIDQMTRLAHSYLDEHQAGHMTILTKTQEAADKFCAHFEYYCRRGRFAAYAIGEDLEGGLDMAMRKHGSPIACVSMPFSPLTTKPLTDSLDNWENVFNEKDFEELCESYLTHHFRIARKISLIDGAQLVLVTPETSRSTSSDQFGLANFIKTSLHAFTVTLGVESERNIHQVPVNQVDLTRRARSEEPQNQDEEEEELNRFVNAVLLTSAPLPDAATSRYRSRIYRGNAIIV
jgi:malonyl-CoA reductase/3-hydroxypropionate dehydrogenase (NADP+)